MYSPELLSQAPKNPVIQSLDRRSRVCLTAEADLKYPNISNKVGNINGPVEFVIWSFSALRVAALLSAMYLSP